MGQTARVMRNAAGFSTAWRACDATATREAASPNGRGDATGDASERSRPSGPRDIRPGLLYAFAGDLRQGLTEMEAGVTALESLAGEIWSDLVRRTLRQPE